MKLYNFIRDQDKKNLREFITQNKINQSENVLVQIFSWVIDESEINKAIIAIKDMFPKINIIWSSTAWEIYDGKYSEWKILLTFSVFEKSVVKTLSMDLNRIWHLEATRLLANFVREDTKALIIFSDAFSPQIDYILWDFFDIRPDIVLAGWKAWDNLGFKNSLIFTEREFLRKWLVVASISWDSLTVNSTYNFGWMEIWKIMKITKSTENRIYELDGIPAIEVYKDNLWDEIAEWIPDLGIEFPLIVNKPNMKIARTAIAKHEDGSIDILGNVKEWDLVQFWIWHKENILNSIKEAYNNVIEKFPVDWIFIYSCWWRKYYLKDDIQMEVEIFWKIAPIAWFFTHWEFFHDSYDNYLLNYTFTTLIISETNKFVDAPKLTEKIEIKDKVVYALSKASARTQEELLTLNSNLQKEVERQINEKEKNLKEFMEWYKRIIDNVPIAIWMWNKDEETIHANSKFCELVETPLEEILWKKSYVFWDKESIEIVKKNNELRKIWEKSTYEWVLISKNKNKVPVKLTWISFVEWWTVWMMQDLRELKKLEEEKEHLEKVSQLKDDFINIASHELRTPLTSIKWYLSMMQDGDFGFLSSEILGVIRIMLWSSERLIQLVNDMLDISKLESGKMVFKNEKLSLNLVLDSIYEEYKNLAWQKWVNFNINIDNDINVITDKNRFKQVIINLLGNAIKFTQEWWTVNINAIVQDNVVKIEVGDTWIWIRSEDVCKIFEKFWQVDNVLTRKQQWTGLGLPIAKEIVHYMWSNLEVESIYWKWSKFYFSLPIQS